MNEIDQDGHVEDRGTQGVAEQVLERNVSGPATDWDIDYAMFYWHKTQCLEKGS